MSTLDDTLMRLGAELIYDDMTLGLENLKVLRSFVEQKYNPQWPRQPRDSHGHWTSGPLARVIGPTLPGMGGHDPRRGEEPVLNAPEAPPKPKPAPKPVGGGSGAQMPGAGAGVH